MPEGLRRQGADPVVLIPQRPHQAGHRDLRRRLADLAQRLDCLGPHPVVAVGQCLHQRRGCLLRRRADGPQCLGRLGADDVIRAGQALDQAVGGGPFSGPTWAIASAAAVRTSSSRSCMRVTRAGTAEAAAFLSVPSARAADALTEGAGVLQQFDQGGDRASSSPSHLAQGLGRLAAHRFVRIFQQSDQIRGHLRSGQSNVTE